MLNFHFSGDRESPRACGQAPGVLSNSITAPPGSRSLFFPRKGTDSASKREDAGGQIHPEHDLQQTRTKGGKGGKGGRLGVLKPSPVCFRGQCCQQGPRSRPGRFSQLEAELEVRAVVLDGGQHPDRSVLQNRKNPPCSTSGSFSGA